MSVSVHKRTEGLAAEKEFGEHGLALCERVFWAWEVFQKTSDRRGPKLAIGRLQREFKPIVARYASKRARNKYCRGMARNLLKAWPALWAFAAHPGVQPTNNHAERSLRSAVIYRKLSLGSQSEGGERRIERLLSARTTCRLQRRSLFVYLTDTLTAHARCDPVPLLTLTENPSICWDFVLPGLVMGDAGLEPATSALSIRLGA